MIMIIIPFNMHLPFAILPFCHLNTCVWQVQVKQHSLQIKWKWETSTSNNIVFGILLLTNTHINKQANTMKPLNVEHVLYMIHIVKSGVNKRVFVCVWVFCTNRKVHRWEKKCRKNCSPFNTTTQFGNQWKVYHYEVMAIKNLPPQQFT